MENAAVAALFELTAQLLELHNQNAFKAKSYATAAYTIKKYNLPILELPESELFRINGIGRGLVSKIEEIKSNHALAELDDLLKQTPAGIIEILQLKGIGPKKVAVIWKQLGIETLGELYYACNENKLVELPGFGLKTQEKIVAAIDFMQAQSGKLRISNALKIATQYINLIAKKADILKVEIVGELRRNCEVINAIELLATCSDTINYPEKETILTEQGSEITVHYTTSSKLGNALLQTTGPEEFVSQYFETNETTSPEEKNIFKAKGLPFIEPELRDNPAVINQIIAGKSFDLITNQDLKGTLHNHSTYSDGFHTLEEMAVYAKSLKLEYLGIADHSQTAFYANGLKTERVLAQWAEIDLLNAKLAPFKILKGIESDILSNGDLDYPTEILAQFDFVVASIHSNLNMSLEKAMERLIKAIENPYTQILGHPTGRLLLSRKGYPIDHEKIIDACAANRVCIELNSNPYRLDIDWRYIDYAQNKGVMIALNPDAHRKEGYHDMDYGVMLGRKGGLEKANTLNAMSLLEIENWFKAKRSRP